MSQIYLRLLETVQPTKQVPWLYDIYDICLKKTAEEVGRIVFRYGDREQLKYCGHIGYSVEPPFRGHGYAALAMRQLLSMMYQKGYRQVLVSCDKNNIASQKTIEKMKIISKTLETEIDDQEYRQSPGLWIYEIEVIP